MARSMARLCVLLAAMLVAGPTVSAIAQSRKARHSQRIDGFVLANGMQVVVVPDHRAPVVTHMVWYRVGAADDPPGKSGLAHFLEHLMFKATAKLTPGEFTRAVTRLGGRHNALTNHDTTSYFQRVAKAHLGTVMALEADRMRGLRLGEEDIRVERDVIREERRSSIDASPIATLNEQMLAALYQNHPYGRPVLGWTHEMTALTLGDATGFYKLHYAPNNALLVVAGDVTVADVRPLAEQIYGAIARDPGVLERERAREPDHIAERTLMLEDERAGATPLLLRYYHVPSASALPPGDAEALQLLVRILGGDDTSRLYRGLVGEMKTAVQAGADYQTQGRDSGRISLLALAAPGTDSVALGRALDDVVAGLLQHGVTAVELQRAKQAAEADHVFEADNVEALARRIGEAITNGRSTAAILETPKRLAAVTADDIQRVAREHLVRQRSVTGIQQRSRIDAAAADKPRSAGHPLKQ